MKTTILIAFVLLLLSIPIYTLGRSEGVVEAVRVETPPVMDGVINPEEYPTEPATGFRQ